MTQLVVSGISARARVWDGNSWVSRPVAAETSIPEDTPRPYPFPTSAPWSVSQAAQTPSYDGSGSMVHPSVLDMHHHGFPHGFRGYRYWAAMTPYSGTNNTIENPSILASNNGWDWHVPNGLTNPIDEIPGSSPDKYGFYNSDTELVWDPDNGRMVVFWRRAFEVIHAAESTDGVNWTRHYRVIWHTSADENRATMLSPSVVRRGPSDWAMFTIRNRGNHGESDEGTIRLWTATDLTGEWVEQGQSDPVPYLWHAAVYLEDGEYRMLANMRAPHWDLRPGVSADGISWTFGGPFLKDGTTYRSAMQPSDEPGMYDLWYSAYSASQFGTDWWVKQTRVPKTIWDAV